MIIKTLHTGLRCVPDGGKGDDFNNFLKQPGSHQVTLDAIGPSLHVMLEKHIREEIIVSLLSSFPVSPDVNRLFSISHTCTNAQKRTPFTEFLLKILSEIVQGIFNKILFPIIEICCRIKLF